MLQITTESNSAGQTLISGQVVTTSNTQCSSFNYNQAGTYDFLALLNEYGGYLWVNALSNNDSVSIYSIESTSNLAYAALVSSSVFRLANINLSSGLQVLEINADSLIGISGNGIFGLLMRADPSSEDLYVSIQIDTSFFAFSGKDLVYMKLDNQFNLKWIYNVHGSTYPLVSLLSNSLTANSFWQLLNIQTGSSTMKYSVFRVFTTNGTVQNEQLWSISQPTTPSGQFLLNDNETFWLSALQYTNDRIAMLIGDTSSNTLLKKYYTSEKYSDMNIAMQQITGNIVIIAMDFTTKALKMIVYDSNSKGLVKAITINRGGALTADKLRVASKGGTIYFAFEKSGFFSEATNKRIVVYKTSDSISIEQLSCTNSSSFTPTNLLDLTMTGSSTSASSFYTPISQTVLASTFFPLVSQLSFVQSTNADQKLYTMRDYASTGQCELPVLPNANERIFIVPSGQLNKNYSFPVPTFTDCIGDQYQLQSLLSASNTGLSSLFYNDINSTFSVRINSHINFTGDFSLKFVVSRYSRTRDVYIKYRVTPTSSDIGNPSTSSHDITSCEESIYPFLYGFENDVFLEDMKLDEFGNLLLAGYGQNFPFGETGTGFNQGFISLQDQRGSRIWHLTVKFMPFNESTSCHSVAYLNSQTYAGCLVPSELFPGSVKFPHILKISHTSGQVMFFKKLPNDNYDPSSQKFLALESSATSNIEVFYRSTNLNNQKSFIALSFNEDTNAQTYYKFYNYLNYADFSSGNKIITDISTLSFFIYRNQAANKVAILRGNLTSGEINTEAKLLDVTNADCLYCEPALYGTDKLLVPALSSANGNFLVVYSLFRVNLTILKSIKIAFTSSYQLSSVSLSADPFGNVYIQAGQNVLYFAMLDSAFSLKYQRVWTGTGQPNFRAYALRSRYYICSNVLVKKCATSEVYSAFQANLQQTGKLKDGFMIFRGTQADNCFDIPDINPANTTWLPTVTNLSTPSANIQAISDISVDLPFKNTDNYPMIYEVFNYLVSNTRYGATNDELFWGEVELDNFYKRYPLQNFKCGMIARNKKFLHDSSIREYTYKSGSYGISVSSTKKNCQDRNVNAQILNPNSMSTTLNSVMALSFANSGSSAFLLYLDKNVYFAQSFKIRYYDSTYSNTKYFQDHGLLIRYFPNYNISAPDSVHNVSACAQSPFPLGLHTSPYNVVVNNIAMNQTDLSFYLAGYLSVDNTYAANDESDRDDAFILKSSQSGAILWMNQINYQQDKNESGLGIATVRGFVYCSVNQTNQVYSSNMVSILKFTHSEGKLVWSKKMVVRNSIDGNTLYLSNIFDLVSNPKNENQIMASVLYSWNQNTGQVPGNIMMYDNGTDLSSLYDYQYKSVGNQLSQTNPGQIFFDFSKDIVYLSALLNISGGYYQDIYVQAVYSGNGSQIWNFTQSTTQQCWVNLLQPALILNNNTDLLYAGVQQSTTSVYIVSIYKNTGTNNRRRLLRLSVGASFLNMDMAADHKTGNIIVLGQSSSNYFEITILDSDLALVQGPTMMFNSYTPNARVIGRYVAQSYDFFYAAFNAYYFSNSQYQSQIAILKKSLNPYEFQKYECQDFTTYTSSSYFTSSVITQTSYRAPNGVNFFSNETLWFSPDFQVRVRMLNQFYTRVQFSTYTYSSPLVSGSKTAYCSSQSGRAGPQTYFPKSIEVSQGNIGIYNLISNDPSTQSCQGDNMTFSQIYDETFTATFAKSYMTKQISVAPWQIKIDATNSPPYPGVRWIAVQMASNSKNDYSFLPVYVWPQVMPAATLEQNDPVCPDNDQQYPKIIGSDIGTGGVTFFSGDLDPQNGNAIMCGQTTNAKLQVIDYNNGQMNAWISQFDQNGVLAWQMAGISTNRTGSNEGAVYTSCAYGANFTGIFGTIFTIGDTYLNALVKHEYITGKVLYITRIQGEYSQEYTNYNFFVIDKSANHIYFTAKRQDLRDYGAQMWNNYIAKIDVSFTYPAQQYYMWATMSQMNQSTGVQAIAVSQSDDYLFSLMNHQTNSYQASTLGLFKKQTGAYIAQRSFRSSAYSASIFNYDVVYDGSSVYVGLCGSYFPKYLWVGKFSVPSLAYQAQAQHNLVDGIYYCRVTLGNDTNFLYAYNQESSYTNKYLTKIQKSDMSIKATTYFNDRSSAQSIQAKIFIYNQMLYLMMGNNGYTKSQSAILHQFTLSLQSSKSCIETISIIPQSTSFTFIFTDDLSSLISFSKSSGQTFYPHFWKFYYEYLTDPNFARVYDSPMLKCKYYGPRFTNDMMTNVLEDQIIQLPVIDPYVYTFNWPQNCFDKDQDFAWSIDLYTTPPSFINVTNTSSTSTFTLTPNSSHIGSYTVRVKYYLRTMNSSFSEFTFVIEIYPEISYSKPSVACSTSNIPATFYKSSTYTEHQSMDMDASGESLVMCGRTKDPLLSRQTSYYSGFLSSFTKGLNLNFHLTIQLGMQAIDCQVQYGFENNIQVAYGHTAATSTLKDTIALLKYSQTGQYLMSKHFSRYSTIDVNHYQIDLSNGDQYLSGSHQGSVLNKGSMLESFILKLDLDYRYVFMYTLESSNRAYVYQPIQGYQLKYTSTRLYQAFMFTHSNRYIGVISLSQQDLSMSWVYGLFNFNSMGSNYLSFQAIEPPVALELANNYLYLATCYYSVGSPAGYENYFIKINPTNGAIQDKVEWQLSTSYCSYHMSLKQATSNPNLIALAWGSPTEITLTLFDIGGSTISYRSNSLLMSNSPSSSAYFYSTFLFERNLTMWGFSRQASTFAGSSENYGHLYKFKDYTNFVWDLPCSIQTSTSNYFTNQVAPNGYNGPFVASANWTNLRQYDFSNSYFTLGTGWSIPSRLFYKWYSNIQNMTSYPINNVSANQRVGLGTCKTQSAPTAPSVPSRLGAPINSTAGGFAVMILEQNMILPQFLQCSGEAMTYSLKFKNGTVFTAGGLFSFDASMLFVSIFAKTNDFVGTHTLTFTAALTSTPSLTASVDFQIQIVKNQAPTPKLGFQNDTIMYARHSNTWIIQAGSDNENDIPSFNVRIFNSFNVNVNSTISWLYVNQSDDTGIILSVIDPNQTLSNTTPDTKFIVQILVWDNFNVATPNTYNFTLYILPNNAPVLSSGINLNKGQIFITQRIYFTIWYQNFTDYEGDQVIITPSISTNNALNDISWLHISVNETVPGNITFYGRTPRDNTYIGTYYFNLQVKDQYANTVNYYQFYVQVYPKAQIELIGGYDDQITQVPNQIQLLFSNQSSDPLGEPNFYSLFINLTQYNPSTMGTWILWNNVTQNLTITPFSNSFIGNHSISIKFEDYISQARYMNFTIQIIPNWPLVQIADQITNKVGIVDNWFYFHHKKEELFMNPEGNPFTMYFRQSQNGNALPYFVSKNYSNGTIGGFPTLSDVGVYQMECVGVDDALWETVISFLLTIKPCYYKCQKCWDAEYNTCQSCKPGYFFYNSECVDLCIDGTYPDSSIWSCLTCPGPCKTCTGKDETTQCPTCTTGYFYLNNGCYIKCPDGYFADKTDYTCKSCHSACSLCYGPSSKQCYNCTELYNQDELGDIQKIGYLLQATSCIIPKCIDGQYFSWLPEQVNGAASGKCLNCHPRCKRCTGPLENQCSQCYPGALYSLEEHNCTLCEEIKGYFTNEQYQCEDICGDGIVVNKQCDDGNLIPGDGCSNLCQIEYGFSCNIPNTPCIEIIPPFFQISAISKINQVFIQFSEPIMISNSSDIGPDNLEIKIEGSLGTYLFTWRMIQDDANPLLPNRKITKFSLIIENYLQSMDGSELISISFKDSSVIKDLAGNALPNKFYSTYNANPFIYLSESETNAASGSASSMKYTFLSVFSFNLVLKVALSSSMQYLWGLVHALQVFSFLLYMNIDFPENLKLFTQYFSVASGDLDEFNAYIPNIANYLIDEDNVVERSDESKLAPPFVEEEMSPYFLISYGQKITIWIFGFLIILPSVLLMNKLCKKVKIWEEIKSSFFFNTPLRGFVEQYLEFIMQLILNTQFMKFKNLDQFIASAFGFVFTAASLLLPFIAMSVIYMNRKYVKTLKWKKKYGMLTEESQTDSVLQLYYYPLFMYQRFLIAGIIVYFFQYPLLQCLLVISCCALMIGFLIQVRPFQEENQQTTTVLDEFVILICVILFAHLETNSETMAVDQKKNLGWVIVAFISFSVIKNFSVVIYFGVINARKSLHSLFGQEDEQIDSPHTSDDEETIDVNHKNYKSEGSALNTEELRKEVEYDIQRSINLQNS